MDSTNHGKLVELLDEFAVTVNELYEIQKEIKAEVQFDTYENYEDFLDDLSHNLNYYTIADFLGYCHYNMIN